MHRLVEFFWIGIIDRFVILVEQRAFAIAFENVAKVPAVAVVIGELCVFQRRV